MANDKKNPPKNKIVLIGNGFDLAHDLPTSYDDFIKFLINERLFVSNDDYSLFDILRPSEHTQLLPFKTETYKNILWDNSIQEITSFINKKITIFFNHPFFSRDIVEKRGVKMILDNHPTYFFDYNSFFYNTVFNGKITNWIDFEKAYYNQLIEYAIHGKYYDRSKSLNEEFNEIKGEFVRYLQWVNKHEISKLNPIPAFQNYFKNWYINSKKSEEFIPFQAENKLILNFNYTQLPERIYRFQEGVYESGVHKIINIHGALEESNNPIIFGYGDEMDEHHHTLESLERDYLLKHFKSTQYSKTHNYHELVDFVELGPYQIDVIGHGCGMTDRVLLNYLFEHDHCDRIKIFHYSDIEHYTETYMHISRHFSRDKKQLLRERVLPYDENTPCPQADSQKSRKFGDYWLKD